MSVQPLGPGDTWKTGQRVQMTGFYADQYGRVSHHSRYATFPPCISKQGECAFRSFLGVYLTPSTTR